MTAIWMVWLLLATALVALGGRAAEEVARGFGWPRRWVWAGGFLLVVSLPWLAGLLPTPSLVDALFELMDGPVPALIPEMPTDGPEHSILPAPAPGASPGTLVNGALLGGWVLGSLALALVFGRALWRVRIARTRGHATRAIDGIEVIRSESLGPATVGILRPAIVLPRWVDDLPESERVLIVSHEREHALARDPLLLAAAILVVVAAPWCLPLWWMHRRLRDAAESDCDARVVARGADRLAYGRALLRAAGRPRRVAMVFTAPLLGGVNVTRLERRILTMTAQRPRHPLLRAIPLGVLAAVAAVVACDAAGEAVGMPDRPPVLSESSDAVADAEQSVSEEGFTVDSISLAGITVDSISLEGTIYERALVLHRAAAAIAAKSSSDSIMYEREIVLRKAIEAESSGARSVSGARWPGTEQEALDRPGVTLRLREHHESGSSTRAEPVFYIDGERVDNRRRALDELDPATIESIKVIKGAQTALYGPGHAAGVVLISTKNR